jgi:hypothetical protein
VILFNQNLHVISAIFGYKFLENRCLREIDNQSFYLLQEIFPSTAKSFGEQSKFVTSESSANLLTEDGSKEMEHFKKMNLEMQNTKLLEDESVLIDDKTAFLIHNYFPRYLQNKKWYLYFSKTVHGSSFLT